MGMRALDPVAYGKLLAAELPQPIQNDRDFDSMVARLEELDFAKRKLTQEEKALREILAALIEVYDEEHYQIPEQETKGVFYHAGDGEAVRMVGITMDVTKRKRMEKALRESAQ